MNSVEIKTDHDGNVLVVISDSDVFDQIDDYLVEMHDLEASWVRFDDQGKIYTLAFEAHLLGRVESAISAFIEPNE